MRYLKVWFDGEGAGDGGTGDGTDKGDTGGAPKPVVFDDNFDFSSVLPDDLKTNKGLEKFSAHKGKAWAENVARSLVSAQGMIGADPNEIVRVPADVAKITSEDRGKFLDRLGLPKDEKAWALKAPEGDLVPGMEVDSPTAKWFTQAARELKIFPDQAQALWTGYGKHVAEAVKLQQAQLAATDKANVETLQKEYGKDFDAVLTNAKFGANKLGGAEFVKRIGDAGLGTDPVFVKAMAEFGRLMSEGKSGGDKNGGGSNGGYAGAAAKAEGQRLLQEAARVMDTDPAKARELNTQAQAWFAKAV